MYILQELEAIKARVREMEEEAEKLKQLQSEVDKQMNMGSPPGISEYPLTTHRNIEVLSFGSEVIIIIMKNMLFLSFIS